MNRLLITMLLAFSFATSAAPIELPDNNCETVLSGVGINATGKKTPTSVVVSVIRRNNTYLFALRQELKEDGGIWAPITGKVEKNESLEEALRREVKEEVGLNVTSSVQLMSHLALSGKHQLFWMDTEVESLDHLKNDSVTEISDLAWLTVDEIQHLEESGKTHPQVTALLLKAEEARLKLNPGK